jgi:hypothetical protein
MYWLLELSHESDFFALGSSINTQMSVFCLFYFTLLSDCFLGHSMVLQRTLISGQSLSRTIHGHGNTSHGEPKTSCMELQRSQNVVISPSSSGISHTQIILW